MHSPVNTGRTWSPGWRSVTPSPTLSTILTSAAQKGEKKEANVNTQKCLIGHPDCTISIECYHIWMKTKFQEIFFLASFRYNSNHLEINIPSSFVTKNARKERCLSLQLKVIISVSKQCKCRRDLVSNIKDAMETGEDSKKQ